MRKALLWLSLGILFGCSKSPDAVGTWHSFRDGADTTWHMFGDGRFETDVMLNGAHGHVKGTYKLTSTHFDLTPSDVATDGEPRLAEYMKGKLMEPTSVPVTYDGRAQTITFEIDGKTNPMIIHKVSPNP